MLVWAFRFLTVVAAVLAGWGVWHLPLARPDATDPPLIIDWPGPDLGEIEIGEHEIVTRITNPGMQTHRVLGMMKWCGRYGCITPKLEEPVAVLPGGTVSYPCLITVRLAAPFEVSVVLFLEERGVREAKTTLHGVAMSPKDKSDGGN